VSQRATCVSCMIDERKFFVCDLNMLCGLIKSLQQQPQQLLLLYPPSVLFIMFTAIAILAAIAAAVTFALIAAFEFDVVDVSASTAFALPVLHVLHVLLSATCFLFISATTIYAMITVVEFFFVAAKRVLVYILKGRQMLSQLRRRPTQPAVVDAHNLLQPDMVTSILRSAGATRRPHDRRVKFSATHGTTCVYPRGIALPLAVQKTFVFNGASILRDPTNRPALLARYGSISQTHYARTRRVGFGPAVKFTGRVTLEPLLDMPIGFLPPILEEEPEHGVEDMEVEPICEEDSTVVATRRPIKRSRSTDDTDVDLAHEQNSSKRVCLRAASQPIQTATVGLVVAVSHVNILLISFLFTFISFTWSSHSRICSY
jgi:hypothetical protein